MKSDEHKPSGPFEKYQHHPPGEVWVQSDLKGLHRSHCLCYACQLFFPHNRAKNCKLANALYDFCIEHNMTTPVWECPAFVPPEETEGE